MREAAGQASLVQRGHAPPGGVEERHLHGLRVRHLHRHGDHAVEGVRVDLGEHVRVRHLGQRLAARRHHRRPQHEQPFPDAADDDRPAREVGIDAPGSLEARPIAGRVGVEEGHLTGHVEVGDVEDAQARGVVGLEDVVPLHVLVVVDRGPRGEVLADQLGVVQIGHVPDERACAARTPLQLIQFVIHDQVAVVFGEPALVRVGRVRIGGVGDDTRQRLVRHVDDRHLVLVRAEAEFFALMLGIGPVVDDALRVVRIAAAGVVVGKTAGKGGLERIADVDGVEAAAARRAPGAEADGISEPRVLVDDNVVRAAEGIVMRVLGEDDRRVLDVQQAGQVEDLQAVRPGTVGDDEGVVRVHLHVTPDARLRPRVQRERSQVHGVDRIGHLDERRPIRAADDGELAPARRVGPSPDVVQVDPALPADVRDGQKAEQVHLVTGKAGRLSARAYHLVAGDGLQTGTPALRRRIVVGAAQDLGIQGERKKEKERQGEEGGNVAVHCGYRDG